MTQKERQERSRQLIYQAALDEFGSRDFDGVTMDSICANHDISKGMMYHYFSNKDMLFLGCTDEIFRQLNSFVRGKTAELLELPPMDAVKEYFLLRETFFKDRGKEKHVFENAMLYPPAHLEEQIQQLRRPIKEENDYFLNQIVDRMELRDGLEREKAIRYLNALYRVFWRILEQYHERENEELSVMLTESSEIMEMVLFGLVKKED